MWLRVCCKSLDPGANISYVSPCEDMRFNMSPEIFLEPLYIDTLISDLVLAKKVYRNCLVLVLHNVILYDLIELQITNFNIILDIDWLHGCYDSIDCRTQVVRL